MSTGCSKLLHCSSEKAKDNEHRLKIAKAIRSYDEAVESMKKEQFRNWDEARNQAKSIKQYTLSHLGELLQVFERKMIEHGGHVLWAEDASEAMSLFLNIAKQHEAMTVIKSKSMTTEELSFNEVVESAGIEVLESDLGEFIVQLAGEKPYHIVTPAMHKSKAEISKLFTDKLGTPPTDNAEDLTAAAREFLREKFCTADIGVTGANFIIADEGAVFVAENEGNARLSLSCPSVHVVFVGIEKVIPRLEQLELFLPLLATSGTGQKVTCYGSIIRGPRQDGEIDGPKDMYVIPLDNGRTKIYSDKRTRPLLSCIRCGACLNACPVFRTIGGHSYGTTYQGPIGISITPHLKKMREWHYLFSLSTLCGACSEACPVGIELHHHVLEGRSQADEAGYAPFNWRVGFKGWLLLYRRRSFLELLRPLMLLGNKFAFLLPKQLRKRVPTLAPKSFAELWKENMK